MMYKEKNPIFFRAKLIARSFVLWIKNILNLIVFLLLKKYLLTRQNETSLKSILIVNTEKMGDLILSFDFLMSLDHSGKFDKYFVLVDEKYFEVLESLNSSIQIISFNKFRYRINPLYRIAILKKLHSLNLTVAINITPERGSVNDELTLLSGAVQKFALKKNSPFLFAHIIYIYNKYYDQFLKAQSDNVYDILENALFYFNVDKIRGDNQIFKYKFRCNDNDSKYIVIAPSTSVEFRNWSGQNFLELTQYLSTKIPIKLLGTSKQLPLLNYIKNNNNMVEVIHDIKFKDIIEVINRADLFIGLDSGLTHLALQINKPVVAIIGGGKFGKFFPYKTNTKTKFLFHQMHCFGCLWNCKYIEPYCINKVSLESVRQSCEEIMNWSTA